MGPAYQIPCFPSSQNFDFRSALPRVESLILPLAHLMNEGGEHLFVKKMHAPSVRRQLDVFSSCGPKPERAS